MKAADPERQPFKTPASARSAAQLVRMIQPLMRSRISVGLLAPPTAPGKI
jgi:hypothetical protein